MCRPSSTPSDKHSVKNKVRMVERSKLKLIHCISTIKSRFGHFSQQGSSSISLHLTKNGAQGCAFYTL